VTDQHLRSQKRVWYQCTVLSGSFVVFWSTYYLKIVFEMVTGKPAEPVFTAMGQGLGLICSLSNSVILMYFDNRIRGNVMKLLKLRKTFQGESPATRTHVEMHPIPQ
jgi:hypothetical protein